MQSARVRLWVAWVLLVGWIGWLGYQALTRGRDYPVLSHSQFLVSTLDVIAEVSARDDGLADPIVTVRGVRWPAGRSELVNKTVTVTHLTSSFGFRGPGLYILPLVTGEKGDEYLVARLPQSPGFEAHAMPSHLLRPIYPVLPITLRQLEAIPKPGATNAAAERP